MLSASRCYPGVCVCARPLGIRVQETQWPIVCLLAFQLASGPAWLHAFTCAACFAFLGNAIVLARPCSQGHGAPRESAAAEVA